ncbi:MAG: FtsX-like permease family protein [Blastocatellia bacterium]
MTVFGLVGLVLAAVGLYGVIAYSVTQRQHEIAIRIALGARGAAVLSLVIREGMTQALVGLAIGLAGALMVTSLISSLLFGVTPTDPSTFACVSILLVAVALLACFIPAYRAIGADPIAALHRE